MAEQIADLVVNLDANTVSFQEQMGRVERQLLESSRKGGCFYRSHAAAWQNARLQRLAG
jgi:hypothetical protein